MTLAIHTKMTTPSNEELLTQLHAELADIERQQQDLTLPHSDQQLLDQAWEDITNRIDALEESFDAYRAYIEQRETAWQDAAEYLEDDSDEEEERPPVTIAPPPPPSLTLQTWIRSDGVVMTGIPPTIAIPPLRSLATAAPPAPRADQMSICNCDADGVCSWCEDRMAEEEDTREDCRYCSGCAYCSDSNGYDPNGEI